MSDYLDNLVSRTLNQTPAVKPRLASLYEPLSVSVSDRDTALFDPGNSSDEQPVKREPFSTSSDPQVNSRLPELAEPRTSHPRVSHSSDHERQGLNAEESRPTLARELNVPFGPLTRSIHEPPRQLLDERPPGLINKPALFAADVRALQPPDVGVVRPSTRKVQEPTPAITSSMSEPDKTFASDLRLKDTLVSKPEPDVPDNRNIPTRLISTQPKGHQSLEIISPQNSIAGPSPEGAGKISVTIGRVDVRAVFAQPRADRIERPKKSTAMSLDDYLKQRTGRGR